jgi:hypothetical protein
MKFDQLQKELTNFAAHNKLSSKGALSVMLVITRSASKHMPPYSPKDFLSPKKGQVAGLGRAAVQSILSEHGIDRVLAEEGGRTSRGSIEKMDAYLQLLNTFAAIGILDFKTIEKWWVSRVKDFFAAKPFKIKIDSSKSIRSIISDLIEATFSRQKECPGTMIAGAVMEHLVGAKLAIALPKHKIEHKGFSVADAPGGRRGDFLVSNTAIWLRV